MAISYIRRRPIINFEIAKSHILEIRDWVSSDKHGTLLREVHKLFFAEGLIDDLPGDPDRPNPFPETFTALQVSLFDNHPSGKPIKSKPHRYAVAMRVWTIPAKKIEFGKSRATFEGHATLFSEEKLRSKAADLTSQKLRNPISSDYHQQLDGIADHLAQNPDFMAGPIFKQGGKEGTFYFDGTVVMLRLHDGGPDGGLYVNGSVLPLAPFVTTDAAGRKLAGNCTHQSRTASNPNSMVKWISGRVPE